jgi:hypothetical protein
MTLTKEISDKELMAKGAEILFKELGSVDAIRFLSMPRPARKESVERHREWQRSLDKKSFYDQTFNNDRA